MKLPGVSQLLHLREVDSTQTLARTLAEQGAEDGTLVWADVQTAGRGRMDRKWDSPHGGLYFSIILRPKFSPSKLANLSLLAAQAAAQALSEHAGIETTVKPPNDVMALAAGKPKKIGGILIEASGNSRKLDWVILGVGINVNNAPRLKSAISLKGLTGKSWDIETILGHLINEFSEAYHLIGAV